MLQFQDLYSALTPLAPTATTLQPLVAILMATYQGESYLPEQLDSFACQTHSNWKLWASDDGSIDNTLPILRRYKDQWTHDQLTILTGPAQGSSRNFSSLIHNPAIQADFYAYSDQDDIWVAEKLARALAWLNNQKIDKPALYCSRTILVDAQNKEIGLSPNFQCQHSFANALVQNIASGNTMVFNDATRRLLCSTPKDTEIVIHDWWTYLVVTACGGTIYFDQTPGLRYRQHENNLIGMSAGSPPLVSRIAKLFGTTLRKNTDINLQALKMLSQHLTPENRHIVEIFTNARKSSVLPRLVGYKKAGIYRMTPIENIGIFIAAIFNRL